MRVNLEYSREVGNLTNAQDKDCFRNSVMALILIGDGAVYVEGFAVAADFPMVAAHGWIEYEGEIVDPTPVYHDGRTERTYFPAKRYTLEEVRARVFKKKGATVPFANMDIFIDPEVAEAHKKAMIHTYGEKTVEWMMTPRKVGEF